MLELAILGLLKEQELHGYELKKRLSDTLGLASGVSFGSLYPALARLETAGAVKRGRRDRGHCGRRTIDRFAGWRAGGLSRSGRSNPRGPGSRGKKVYRVTERGHVLFYELLAAESQSTEDDRLFNLRLAFARYLPPDARLGMLERRRAHLLDRLARVRARVKAGRERDGYTRSLMEHDREAAEHDLSWIEHLIASERSGGPEGRPAPRHSTRFDVRRNRTEASGPPAPA